MTFSQENMVQALPAMNPQRFAENVRGLGGVRDFPWRFPVHHRLVLMLKTNL